MKRAMGLAKPQNAINQMTNFFQVQEDNLDVKAEDNCTDQKRKIKSCAVCKVQKSNHIVKAYVNTSNPSGNTSNNTSTLGNFQLENTPFNDSLRQQVLNLAPREVIEQVIFDPQHGIVKREIHFGLIDYLTVSVI